VVTDTTFLGLDDTGMDTIQQIISELLSHIGIQADIGRSERNGTTVYNIRTEDAQLLIGANGAHLRAFEHLVRLLARRQGHDEADTHFVVDIEDYRKRREDFLKMLATRAAEEVRQRRCAIMLKPMSAYERRIIHLYVANYSDVMSESRGEGLERRVLIRLKEQV
jgi:spoIIIJ-associated protein